VGCGILPWLLLYPDSASLPHTIQLTIENAAHHVMVDQPHALVDSINSVLRQWRLD